MLETEIKKLTAAVTRLADLMEQTQAPTPTPAPSEAESQAPAPSEAPVEENETETPVEENETETPVEENEQSSGFTIDDIKTMALAISRKDRSKRDDIKAKLAEHDAKVATDLSGDALQSVGMWLAELSGEIGA